MLAIARVLMLNRRFSSSMSRLLTCRPSCPGRCCGTRCGDSPTRALPCCWSSRKRSRRSGCPTGPTFSSRGGSKSPARPARLSPVPTYARFFSANPQAQRPEILGTTSTPSHVHHEDRKAMSETGERVDDPSRPRDETSDHPSGMIRQPALRARGKYVSKSEMVTDALRELITDRQLSPGTLRQRDLAKQFDVSYTPVREALRRLESEGLVVTDVHRGATVARTESEEMAENYRILAALEALAGSLAVSKMTSDDVTEIEALYRQVAACQPDDNRLAELNRQFHFRITSVHARRCCSSSCDYCGGRFLGAPGRRPHQESVRQHAQLVRALKRRNEEQVAAIIRDRSISSLPGQRRRCHDCRRSRAAEAAEEELKNGRWRGRLLRSWRVSRAPNCRWVNPRVGTPANCLTRSAGECSSRPSMTRLVEPRCHGESPRDGGWLEPANLQARSRRHCCRPALPRPPARPLQTIMQG